MSRSEARGVGGGFGHHKPGAALFIERGAEELNPEVIGVVGARQAQGKAAARSDRVSQPLPVHGVDVEGWIGEDEVEAAGGVVRAWAMSNDEFRASN